MRNVEKEKFKIYYNGNLAYSYNECFTKEESATSTIYPGHVKNKYEDVTFNKLIGLSVMYTTGLLTNFISHKG